jgi:hypothetical protein
LQNAINCLGAMAEDTGVRKAALKQ